MRRLWQLRDRAASIPVITVYIPRIWIKWTKHAKKLSSNQKNYTSLKTAALKFLVRMGKGNWEQF